MAIMKQSQLRGIPEINLKTCLCCSVRTGSLIIGYMNWIGSMIIAGTMLVLLLVLPAMLFLSTEKVDAPKGLLTAVWFGALILFGITMVLIKICRQMIMGVKQNQSSLMIPYIYTQCAMIILSIPMNIFRFVFYPPLQEIVVSQICSSIIGFVVGIYLLMVVISHCQKIISMERHGTPANMASV